MKEFINNFLENYVYYKPVNVGDYDVHNMPNITDTSLNRVERAAETIYDPNFGFENGRKVRVARATPEEIFSANVPNKARDYCADHYIRLQACRRDNLVSFYGCHHYREEYLHCKLLDAIFNQKEFEREKRLMYRNKRLKRMEIGLEN